MTLMDLIWTSAASIPAALSAWLAARALEPHLSPRLGVRLWQAARLAAFAPVLVVLGSGLIPHLKSANAPSAPVTLGVGTEQTVPVAMPLFQPVLDFAELSISSIPAALLPLIAGLYLVGLALMAVRGVIQRGQIRTLMRASIAEEGRLSQLAQVWRTRLGLPQTLAPVRVVDAVISPFVVGFKPVILAPDTLAKRDDAEAAIAHELMHIKRGDERDRLIGEALSALMWFNPVYRAIERRLAAARELACDADVLDAMGPEHRQHYAEAIAGLAPMPAVATGFHTDLERLRLRRVRAALSHTGRKPRMLVAMMAGAAILLAGAPSAALAVMLSGQDTVQIVEPRVLSESVGAQILAAQEATNAGEYQQALDILSETRPMTPYDRYVVEELRARALFRMNDYAGTITAFQAALESGGASRLDQGRNIFALVQLYLVLDRETEAALWAERYRSEGHEVSDRVALTFGQLYLQMERFNQARQYYEQVVENDPEVSVDTLIALDFVYQELGVPATSDLRRYLEARIEAMGGIEASEAVIIDTEN